MSVATLRVRVTEDADIHGHLRTAFSRLYRVYKDNPIFEVVCTCNAVLQGNNDDRLSVWFGLDYSNTRRNFELNQAQVVRNLGDVANIDVDWDLGHFSNAFYNSLPDSDVTVLSLINLVFIIRKYMDDYRNEVTVGQRLTFLY